MAQRCEEFSHNHTAQECWDRAKPRHMALPVNPIQRENVCRGPVCLIGHFKDLCSSRVWLLVLVRALQPHPILSISQREVEGEGSEQKAVEERHGQNCSRNRGSIGSF